MLGSIIQGDPGECFVFWRSRCFRQRSINRYGIKYRRQTGNRISCSMGLLPDTENCGLRRHREWRERFPPLPRVSDPDMHHGTCVTHVSWCKPWSLTRVYLWSQWRGKHSRHSRHMRNPQLYITGKRPMALSHNGSGCFPLLDKFQQMPQKFIATLCLIGMLVESSHDQGNLTAFALP